jgi:hypothetical protein
MEALVVCMEEGAVGALMKAVQLIFMAGRAQVAQLELFGVLVEVSQPQKLALLIQTETK